ncbi:hypothetical protein FHL15_011104 [Xylaria flabelliformis]|uniref:Uncharacterized protein n=1 Tax=Xylaria flabelliformis TaxID=2512241 RepID=A0A553HJ82_9PEZI|nr:hypothetical protein FHL15_011104 [Xylaria flabelliformis]
MAFEDGLGQKHDQTRRPGVDEEPEEVGDDGYPDLPEEFREVSPGAIRLTERHVRFLTWARPVVERDGKPEDQFCRYLPKPLLLPHAHFQQRLAVLSPLSHVPVPAKTGINVRTKLYRYAQLSGGDGLHGAHRAVTGSSSWMGGLRRPVWLAG